MKTKNLFNFIVSFALICSICLFAGFNAYTKVNAAEPVVFGFQKGASIRCTPGTTGMRFKLDVPENIYNNLIENKGGVMAYKDETKNIGMFIVPEGYVSDCTDGDYYNHVKGKNPVLKLDFPVEKLEKTADHYIANGVIQNIRRENIDKNFVAVGYYYDKTANKFVSVLSDKRTVDFVASNAIRNEKDLTDEKIEVLKSYIKNVTPIDINPNSVKIFNWFGENGKTAGGAEFVRTYSTDNYRRTEHVVMYIYTSPDAKPEEFVGKFYMYSYNDGGTDHTFMQSVDGTIDFECSGGVTAFLVWPDIASKFIPLMKNCLGEAYNPDANYYFANKIIGKVTNDVIYGDSEISKICKTAFTENGNKVNAK